ncbi:MAG: hypothetical protein WKG00_22620 [Polyangiaceae bacterium]
MSKPLPSAAAKLPELLDAMPADARGPVALFAAHLADVRFPDVDVDTVAALIGDLRARSEAAARARAGLDEATAAEAAARAALGETLSRGVAYARIFAAAHPERAGLATALAELGVAPGTPSVASSMDAPRRRRGRPPKQRAGAAVSELLVTHPVPAPAPAAAHAIDADAPESARYATAASA